MKRNIQNTVVRKKSNILMLIFCLLITTSCNKEFNTTLRDSYPEDGLGVGDGDKKVLYIIMDGVRGTVLKDLATPNLTEITRRSIFTYDGLADYERNPLTNAAAWTTMLTGVDYTIHQVESDDFANFNATITPTLFSRIKAELDGARTVALTSSASFNDHLAEDATFTEVYSGDSEVKDAVVKELELENPSLILAEFHGADLAASGNYSTTNQAYVDAVRGIDGYIGDVLEALRARKTFSSENWLVIIASNKGGGVSGTDPGENIYNDLSRNTFVAFYNPKFKTEQFSKPTVDGLPYTGSAPRFITQNPNIRGTADLGSNTTVGNFGTSGDYTLMFKFRDNNPARVSGWPAIFGKQNPATAGVGGGGWEFNSSGGGTFQFSWNGVSQKNMTMGTANIGTKDMLWHTAGFTLSMESGKRWLTLYYDDVTVGSYDITGKNADTDFPMFIGAVRDGSGTNFLLRDLVVLDVALSDQAMKTVMRKEFGPNSLYFSNAIGWWPANESSGASLSDRSGKGNDFILKPGIQFTTFSDLSPNISPDISEAAFRVVPNGVDIPVMIYNWMNIGVSEKWGLMGKFYMPVVNLPKD